ncbi:hypothetical protein F7725_006564 [Dissostichus mawsoni]|uniref:Sodium/potassium-transporting ATPase subunit beta n=1 Tax=Dissostichus mawsoni TaxID=36200 RepID=A0A7J5XUB4_DISMA|nr:hypothetical protein F7725_006564 [Dissostichus mawsoni]
MYDKMAKDGDNGWKEYVWNPRTREFLGRTASSWGLILLFYLVFYIFLAGMFCLTMYVMLQTLDDHKPKWQDRLSTPVQCLRVLTPSPLSLTGMVIRPKADEYYEITYNTQKTESWDMYAQTLDKFLSRKSGLFTSKSLLGEVKNNPKRSCQFNRTILEDCSGINDRYYGYQDGKPCIIIKLNRVIGMLPGKDGQAPFVTCGAKVNYSQPLVAVKFLNITTNEDVNIECRINANNIPTGSIRDKWAGRVSFKLRINTI